MAGVPAGRLSIEIVAEIARLQSDLDKVKKLVATASGDIAKSAKAANDNLAGLSGGMAKMAPNAKLAAFGARNLAFQVQDLGVQFAMAANSSNPLRGAMMAIVQQGPQIKDALNQMGKSVGGLALGFVKAHPLLTAFAVAAGVAAGAMKLFTSEVNKSGEIDRYAKSLGLTTKELKKLEDVGVTATDVFTGLWRVMDKGLEITPTFNAMKSSVVGAFRTMIEEVIEFLAVMEAAQKGTESLASTLGKAGKQLWSGNGAGALTTLAMGDIGGTYQREFAKAKTMLNKVFGDIGQASIQAAKDRIAGQARVLIDDRTIAKAKKEGKTLGETLAESIEKAMIELRNMGGIVDPTEILAARLKAEDAAAKQARQDAKEGQDRVDAFYKQLADEQRQRAIDTAYDIADIIGGRLGSAIAQLADVLDRVLPDLMSKIGGKAAGKLGSFLGQMGANAMMGSAIGDVMKGLGVKTSSTGAALGGVIGGIPGAILGGVIGGLFKKVKKASATIEIMAGDAVQSSLTGNSSKLKAVAGAMADSLIGGLMGIADQLGGMLGDGIRVSIGQRDKTFRVDLAGLGRTKNMPKFNTEEEAVAFAIQSVIQQGAITGLRAGTETLIKGQGDLEAQLQKANLFENVFRELEQRANPAKASIAAITKEFAALIDIFEEAGAAAEDFAKLQELMAIRQKEAIQAAFDPIRTMLDDLESKAVSAGEAVRAAAEAAFGREAAAVEAYEAAVAAAREAGLQRWRDAVATGYREEIDRLQAGIGALRDEAKGFADIAARLRGFAAGVFEGATAVRFSAAGIAAAAQAGNVEALGRFRDTAISGATDRVSMIRRLALVGNAASGAAGGFEARASAAERTAAAMESQVALVEKQLEALGAVEQSAVSIETLMRDMQTAVQAADLARAQMALLGELTETEASFAEAVAAYEAAKAARDDLIRDITAAGFAGMIAAQQSTAAQLMANLSAVQSLASQALADAAARSAAIQAAQAAAAVANDNPWSQYMGAIPGFASGGMHGGGVRMVGERGWEVEATGPARYWNQEQLGAALAGADAEELARALADELRPYLLKIEKNTGEAADMLDSWDVVGQPAVRTS
jgi:hypothetical protein